MSLFNRNKPKDTASADNAPLAVMALNSIHDGVIITDKNGIIKFINPAAVSMTECGMAANAIGLDYGLLLKLRSKEGRDLEEAENPLIQSMRTSQPLEKYACCLVASQSAKVIPIAISVIIAEGTGDRIITFRNITKELAEEGEQAEFISTASHEMRTPVATIDGYLSLALNPQTAAIDERARGYLTAAQAASKHLGKLFQDLLDVTKLDDGRIRPKMVPVEMVGTVKQIADAHMMRAREAKIDFRFGTSDPNNFGDSHRLEQVVYGFVDIDFLREIIDNLIDNAIKYTPAGGSIYVNVRGDGDRVLINVTDTGIGISSEDIGHIFQKFYRADNSDTREIGGTGLGLYLVKQRVEAMGGRVWAESGFGEGSTFFVSLPRLSNEEYEKRMIVVRNQQALLAQSPPPQASPPAPPVPQQASSPQSPPILQTPTIPQQQINNQIGGQQ
ncbi:PAS domain-containing sensor histidine kinase [Candidatus Saccharibacteria bacterium]|nr:PAS domain-containing sensor histidine kinase [Candidatus Saccharibacteria bacterium]